MENLVIFIPIILWIIWRSIVSPNLKLYNNCSKFIKLRIFLFSPKCRYCGQIATRHESNGLEIDHCCNTKCRIKAHKEGWTPFSSSSGPLETLGWKYNKEEI